MSLAAALPFPGEPEPDAKKVPKAAQKLRKQLEEQGKDYTKMTAEDVEKLPRGSMGRHLLRAAWAPSPPHLSH
eukprot:7747414-Pyramimonas_sp.AAC.1